MTAGPAILFVCVGYLLGLLVGWWCRGLAVRRKIPMKDLLRMRAYADMRMRGEEDPRIEEYRRRHEGHAKPAGEARGVERDKKPTHLN